jgi:hypothetical protein
MFDCAAGETSAQQVFYMENRERLVSRAQDYYLEKHRELQKQEDEVEDNRVSIIVINPLRDRKVHSYYFIVINHFLVSVLVVTIHEIIWDSPNAMKSPTIWG